MPAATSATIAAGRLDAGPIVRDNLCSTSLSARTPGMSDDVVEKWERNEASTAIVGPVEVFGDLPPHQHA